MIGVIVNSKGMRSTFVMGMCETCKVGGKVDGTLVRDSKEAGTFKVSRPVPTLFEKEDVRGRRYDRLCGRCIDRIEMLEVKRAGIEKVTGQ